MLGIARLLIPIALTAMIIGCARSGRQNSHWTRVHPGESAIAGVPGGQKTTNFPLATSPAAAIEEPPSGTATPVPAPGVAQARPANWVRLGDWAHSTLGITPLKVMNGAGEAYLLETEAGKLLLTPETRVANFEGVSLWLGFAPFWARGDCLVHELDLRKNILPLLTASAAGSPNPGTVVIDPGHGGSNLGTRSVLPNVLEKELTLDWALRLEPLLKRHGWTVVLTRRDDRELDIVERVQVADDCGADLFLSLHFNSALPQTEQHGLETFCTTPAGLPSTLTRGYEDDTSRAFPNNAHDEENLRYAMRLHRALLRFGGMPDRSVRRARFMGVLRGQQRPAVLLEAGYLSNLEEARRAATPAYRQQLAEAVAHALAPPPALASRARPDLPDDRPTGASE